MATVVRLVILTIGLLAAGKGVVAQPPAGSQLPPDENNCAMCHGEADLWEGETLRLHILPETLAEDVHFLSGVNCHDCHGGDPGTFDVPQAHGTEAGEEESEVIGFRFPLEEVWNSCRTCHEEAAGGLAGGAHAQLGERDAQGRTTPMDCRRCHGDKAHGILPVEDKRSPVFLNHQVQLCGGCHAKALAEYRVSVHGHGLEKAGLVVTAVCADCHGAHRIDPASDPQSPLYAANVAFTCAKCHRFIQEQLAQSVHGAGQGPGRPSPEPAAGGDIKRTASCTDCHQGHDLPHPRSLAFRQRLPGQCGGCHGEMSEQYALSMHGQLTQLGYGPAAKCSDCHGAHDILPISDSQSRLAPGSNRVETCRKCHPGAEAAFADFQPHADHRDFQQNPLLSSVYLGMEILLYSVFGFFGLHMLLWFARSLVHTIKHGRPARLRTTGVAYVRFEPIHRVLHTIIIVSFLGLALTGLPLKYSDQAWAKNLAYALGGFDSTSVWHHIFAVVTFFYFFAHLAWMARKVLEVRSRGARWRAIVFGPDSPVPNFRDLSDLSRMGRWFVGRGPKPSFERWSYWEKFDYWAVFWGVAIIGTSGLLLWFPSVFTRFLPGEALNIAKVIHSEEALLATGFIFAVHFFHTHFRPEKFPVDMCLLTGLVSEEELKDERPQFYQRLENDGALAGCRGEAPSQRKLGTIALGGYVALVIGLGLLVGIMLAVFGHQ